MDTKSNKKTRSAKTHTKSQAGRANPRREAQKGRALKKPHNTKKSPVSGNIKKDAQKVKESFWEPIKHELMLLIEYINIMELRRDITLCEEVTVFLEFMECISRNCEMYLKGQLMKVGMQNGN